MEHARFWGFFQKAPQKELVDKRARKGYNKAENESGGKSGMKEATVDHGALAEAHFRAGKGCCQSILAAFAPELGMQEETALRLGSPFGGGMGRLREVCGVFTGCCMVLGLLYGGYDPRDQAAKSAQYERVQQMAAVFRRENGSIVCRELLGLPGASAPTPEIRTGAYYKRRPCAGYVRLGGEILDRYLRTGSFAKGEQQEA